MGRKPAWWMVLAATAFVGCQNSDWSRRQPSNVPPNTTVRPGTTGQMLPGYGAANNATGWNNRTLPGTPVNGLPSTYAPPVPANPGLNATTVPGPSPAYGNPTPVQIQQSHYGQNTNAPTSPLAPWPPAVRSGTTTPAPGKPAAPNLEGVPKPDAPILPANLNNNPLPVKPQDTTVRTTLPSLPTQPAGTPGAPPASIVEPVFPSSPPNPPIR
ncbi:MAG: hypothetical protein NZM42_07965 [Gemmatales bacterium]|nr:hypothetical protein [Gemmatales bacterium]MDW8222206.1 hypothetical protein [Gemmatales bacterium]